MIKSSISVWLLLFIPICKITAVDRLSLEDFSGNGSYLYRWKRVPVAVAQAESSAINSGEPLISCERVREVSQVASALLKEIFQEQEKLLGILEHLRDASQEELEELLHKAREVAEGILQKTKKLSEIFPPSLQKKDRIRTLSWTIPPGELVHPTEIDRIKKFEWAQLEVLSGQGGWTGRFLSGASAERPMARRFQEFLRIFDGDPVKKLEIEKAFSFLLRTIQEQFNAGTPGSRGMVDWQGANAIQLVQELSPVEGCVGSMLLSSSLLVDFEIQADEVYPNPALSLDPSIKYLGMGPVVLVYIGE